MGKTIPTLLLEKGAYSIMPDNNAIYNYVLKQTKLKT